MLILYIVLFLRLRLVNIKKQNSFKKRSNHKWAKKKFKIGDIGVLTTTNFRFEFIYFLTLKKFIKKNLKTKYNKLIQPKVWIDLRSNYPLTRKSKNSRMGKGKGSFLRWSILTYKNKIIIEFLFTSKIRVKKIVNGWNFSLSKKLRVV